MELKVIIYPLITFPFKYHQNVNSKSHHFVLEKVGTQEENQCPHFYFVRGPHVRIYLDHGRRLVRIHVRGDKCTLGLHFELSASLCLDLNGGWIQDLCLLVPLDDDVGRSLILVRI